MTAQQWKKKRRDKRKSPRYQVKGHKQCTFVKLYPSCPSEILFSVTGSFRAATAVGASAAVSATTALGCPVLALGRWGRANKCVVNVNSLVEKLGVVQVLNSVTSFREGGVFDQCVALANSCVSSIFAVEYPKISTLRILKVSRDSQVEFPIGQSRSAPWHSPSGGRGSS